MFPLVSDTHVGCMRLWKDDEIRFTSMGALFKRS